MYNIWTFGLKLQPLQGFFAKNIPKLANISSPYLFILLNFTLIKMETNSNCIHWLNKWLTNSFLPFCLSFLKGNI